MDIKSEIIRIQSFVERGNYHAAMNLAISALNECRRQEDQAGVDTFLRLIHDIAAKMTQEFGSRQ